MRARGVFFVCLAMALAAAGPATAQTSFGVRGGAYFNQPDPFIGAELLVPVERAWYFNPNLELVFGDDENAAIASADIHWDFAGGGRTTLWVGAGLALIFRDFEDRRDTETDVGLNVLGGYSFGSGRDTLPYVQAKLLVSDDTRGAVAFGVRF